MSAAARQVRFDASLDGWRRIRRVSIAQTPYPEPGFPVMAPAAEPVNRAFAQSGQTSRP